MHLDNRYIQKAFFQGVADKKLIYKAVLNAQKAHKKSLVYFISTQGFMMWRIRDSNPRPSECHSDALPTELIPHKPFSDAFHAGNQKRRFGKILNSLFQYQELHIITKIHLIY